MPATRSALDESPTTKDPYHISIARRQAALILAAVVAAFLIAFLVARTSQGSAPADPGGSDARPVSISLPAPRAEGALPGVSLPPLRPGPRRAKKSRKPAESNSSRSDPATPNQENQSPSTRTPTPSTPSNPTPANPAPSNPTPRPTPKPREPVVGGGDT